MELVNAQRRAAGLPPLKRVEALAGSARWFAGDMAREDYFARDHDTYRREGGRLVRACDWSTRLGWFYPGWSSLAENIAAGYATPEEVVAGWLGSAAHRAKMLGQSASGRQAPATGPAARKATTGCRTSAGGAVCSRR